MYSVLGVGQVDMHSYRHELALEQAKASSKTNYNLIYDLLARLHSNLHKILASRNYPKRETEIEIE